MSHPRIVLLCCALSVICSEAGGGSLSLTTKGPATVWNRTQTIAGTMTSPGGTGSLVVNGREYTFSGAGLSFSLQVQLSSNLNVIYAYIDSAGTRAYSDTLLMTLGYALHPECSGYATVSGRTAALHVSLLDNPDSTALTFRWKADARNPVPVALSNPLDSAAGVIFPEGVPDGEYYFDLTTISSNGDTGRARTAIIVDSGNVRAMDVATDHARWIDTAIIYGITPNVFVENGSLADITAKIPEIVKLGVTTIWLQPTMATHYGGQGYDVIDYFRIRPDVGAIGDLRTLVAAAHANGLKVILDFVPNHTSLYHPYAQDAIKKGAASHYFDFYQKVADTAPYSENYHTRTDGLMSFIYYFWNELPNLNYGNAEVQKMIVEASRYWIEQCDVDGYRIDAVWGVVARAPDFVKQWRLALKRVKPEILLLAEDKAPWPSVFDQRFDAAYDWTAEQSWVSHWAWQTSYASDTRLSYTIFNTAPAAQRNKYLTAALTNNGAGFPPKAIVMRFMENNDLMPFLATHDVARTTMAAGLLYALPGIPLLFNGQETGNLIHPYDRFMIYQQSQPMRSLNPGMFDLYSSLAAKRQKYPSLRGTAMAKLPVSPATSLFGFRRWAGNQNIVGLLNMDQPAANALVTLPVGDMALIPNRTYYLTDLLTGESFSAPTEGLSSISIPMSGYSTRWLFLDTTVVTGLGSNDIAQTTPEEFRLEQNYPNPFNPSTTIVFNLPSKSSVRLRVFNVVGQQVATLVDGTLFQGRHSVAFDARALSSGTYFYRLEANGSVHVRKMLLLR